MSAVSQEAQARKLQALGQALGPVIASALADPDVVEVIVNPNGAIWTDGARAGRVFTGAWLDASAAERVLRLVADHAGQVVNAEHPLLSAVLPVTGERFQGVCAPLSRRPSFAIRKRPAAIFSLESYVEQGIITPGQLACLAGAAAARANILVVGGAGSGKTTLANAILALPAFSQDRVVLIEDTAELQCAAPDQLALLTRPSAPAINMSDLVRAALRLRPDRIVIGEVRDASALDLIKAWNTGHPGGLATLHANSAFEALWRLEDLMGEAVAQPPCRSIGQAIDLIVFLKRTASGRRLEGLLRVEAWTQGGYRTCDLTQGDGYF